MDAKGKKNNWKGSPSKNNEGQFFFFLEQLWQQIVWINVPLKDEIVQEKWGLFCFFHSVYATVCPWSMSRYMQHFRETWDWKIFMGMWAVFWSTSSIPLPIASYRKEALRGLNSDSTLAIFTLSGDVSGCLEYQQIGMAVAFLWVLCSFECQSNTC